MKSQSLHRIRELLEVLERTTGDPGDLTGTLQHIAQTAQTFFAADDCVILAINPINGRFIASLTIAGDLLEEQISFEQPRPQGNAQEVLKQSVLLVEDLEVTPERHSTFTRLEGIRSFAGLALRTKYSQKPLGVLYLDFRQPQKFSSDDQELFQLFADQASYILQETWLLQRYQEVARIGQEINQELDTVDLLFYKLHTHAAGILDISHTLMMAVYQHPTNTADFYLQEEGQFIHQQQRTPRGACQYTIQTRQTVFIEHLSQQAPGLPFQISHIPETAPKESFIFVPLMLREEPLGVLAIEHPEPHAYSQEDQSILELLSNHIALALHNIRLYRSLNQLNETGETLTQQLDSEETLQATVDKIREATTADLVVLYPYEPSLQRFVLPPRIAGELLDLTFSESMSPNRPGGISTLILRRTKPIFAKQNASMYTDLPSATRIRPGSFGKREQLSSTAALPLRVGEQVVGVLFINFRQPQRFDATQKLFIEGLGHYAAIAIKNAQAFRTLIQRRLRELETLQHIDRELNRTLDLKKVLDTLLRLAHDQVSANEVAIWLYNPQKQALEVPAAIGLHAEDRQTHVISLHENKGITRWVLEQKKPARVANVRQDLAWRDLYVPGTPDTISELDVPLLDGDEAVGVLNFESTQEGAFRQEDQDFLLTLAGQAVLAIKKAQAYEREKRLAEEGQVLNEISKQIISHLNHVHVFDLILEKALELTHSTLGSLHLYDPIRNDVWMAAERGVSEDNKGKRQGLGQGIVGYVAEHKQLQDIEDVTQLPWNKIYMEFFPGARSELAVPMLAGNELRGVLNVESPNPNNFNESDERLLQGLADLAVVALQNAQAYEREKRLAEEGQVLNEISKEIIGQLDLAHVFDLILEKALELTTSHMGNLMLFDVDQNDLWMAAERGMAEEKKGQRQKLDQGIVGYVARNKQLLNVDLSRPPWNEIYLEFFPGACSELAVPMLAGDELRGVLNVESPNPNTFNESDERLLQGLADLAVVALQNVEHYRKAEREAQRFALLYRAGQELSRISDLAQLEQAYDAVMHIAEEQSQSLVVIRRYDENTQELELICASQPHYAALFRRTKLDVGINGQVARERRTIVIHNIKNPPPDVVSPQPSDPTTRSLLITPILFKEQYYGNLGLDHKDVGHFQGADQLFFEGLAQQLASTIHRLETAYERQEFKQRAIAAEAMSSMGQAAFELAHRWGSDLGLVRSYVNNVSTELKKHNVKNIVISEKLENIVQAVRKVLDLSKQLKHQLLRWGEASASEPVVIHPAILLEEALDIPSRPSTIQICLEIDDDVTVVRVTHSLVTDILHNLVTNAIEAMPTGGKITLRARNSGRSVVLEVGDTGPGIPKHHLSKIFDLFYSTKGSTGFGLWSARRNALSNHGDLIVKSEVGQGTTFTLLLPKVEGETL